MSKTHIYFDYLEYDGENKPLWTRRDIVFDDNKDVMAWVRRNSWCSRVKNIKEYPYGYPNKS